MEPATRHAVMRAAAWVARALVGVALVVAGSTKVIHPATFITDIWSYRLVPESWAYWIAAFLPWLEIVAGAALVTDRQRSGARLIAATLLLVFLLAIVISWMRGIDIACGCFGGSSPTQPGGTDYVWLVTRDLLLIACLAFDWLVCRRLSASQRIA